MRNFVLCSALVVAAGLLLTGSQALGQADQAASQAASQPVDAPGEPVLEEPTLHCLGAYWIVAGDEKKEFRIDMEYRKGGETDWRKSMPMFRVRKGDSTQRKHEAQLNPPADAWLFAGSVVNLTPGTDYELKLTLVKPDGAKIEKILKSRTASEPVDPPDPRICHVVPGNGGGDGSEKDPYQGLDYAQSEARPGTIFLVHKGVYEATFHVTRSGIEGQPVIYRGAGDGEAVIDGGGKAKQGIELARVHDVRFENLSIRGVYMGISGWNPSRVVVRRCHIYDVKCGIYFSSEDGRALLRNNFISDNTLDGPFTWGKNTFGPTGNLEWRGIQITGVGYDVCYNRIRNFKDGVDTFPSKYCAAIDFHHNEVSGAFDDGAEMDFSERNTRCFLNRFVNVHQGISEQPIFGGPVYIFRNALYNVQGEAFKLHHVGGANTRFKDDFAPSGAILYHNTIVKIGDPFIVHTSAPMYNCVTRNNLFIGGGKRAMDFDPPVIECDFDYDGFGGGPWDIFMKWSGEFYKTFEEAKAKAPVEKHAVLVDAATVFAGATTRPTNLNIEYDSAKVDLRLKKGSAACEAGEILPGFNDGFTGKAPSLGAYELGSELPHYGPRPEKK